MQQIERRQTALMQIYREAFGEPEPEIKPELNGARASTTEEIEIDETLLTQIRESATGERFIRLFDNGEWEADYSSQSEADLALVGDLRFWVWQDGGAMTIDAYFRASKLMRDKWDEKRGKQTYGERTIAQATKGDFDYYGREPDAAVEGQEQATVRAASKIESKAVTRSKTGTKAGVRADSKAGSESGFKTTQDGFAEFDPTIDQEHRIAAPRLPIEVFGPQWAAWLVGTAKAKAAPVDFTAMPLLTASASLIGNARRVAPWPEWIEATILWTARVGEPSTNKTPGAQPIYDTMGILQWEQKDQFAEIVRRWEQAKLVAKREREEYSERLKKDTTEKEMAEFAERQAARVSLPKTAIEPPRPVEPSLMTIDATMESLGPLLVAQPKGFLERREELAGWISGFDKYVGRGGSERSFWIEAYNGHSYNIRREKFKGGSLDIKYLAISIEGSMQPDRLGTLLLEGDDDGLTARFLFSWPDRVEFERPSGQPDREIALNALRRLRDLDMVGDEGNETFKTVMFNPAAANLFAKWRTQYPQGEKDLSGKPLSWRGKLPGVVLRLSLVLTYLRWAIDPKGAKESPGDIPMTRVSDAIKLVEEYFIPMANRVFGDAQLPEPERNAKALARKIKERKTGTKIDGQVVVNSREIQQQHINGMKADAVHEALTELIAAGWLRPIKSERSGPGRRREDFTVNPQVFSAKTIK